MAQYVSWIFYSNLSPHYLVKYFAKWPKFSKKGKKSTQLTNLIDFLDSYHSWKQHSASIGHHGRVRWIFYSHFCPQFYLDLQSQTGNRTDCQLHLQSSDFVLPSNALPWDSVKKERRNKIKTHFCPLGTSINDVRF